MEERRNGAKEGVLSTTFPVCQLLCFRSVLWPIHFPSVCSEHREHPLVHVKYSVYAEPLRGGGEGRVGSEVERGGEVG